MTLLTTNQTQLHLIDIEKCFILEIKTDIEKFSERQTPPISGQYFFAPTVSANWREYCSTLATLPLNFEKRTHPKKDSASMRLSGMERWPFQQEKN